MIRKLFFVLFFLVVSGAIISMTSSAYTIPSTGWEYLIGNVIYTVNSTMDFSDLNYSDSWIQFNTTRLNVTSENNINVTLIYLSDTSGNGIELLNISVNTTSGNVTINIGGLRTNSRHRVTMNGTALISTTSNSSGWISFTNDAWSTQYFQVYSDYVGSSRSVGSLQKEEVSPSFPGLVFFMIVFFIILITVFLLIFTD